MLLYLDHTWTCCDSGLPVSIICAHLVKHSTDIGATLLVGYSVTYLQTNVFVSLPLCGSLVSISLFTNQPNLDLSKTVLSVVCLGVLRLLHTVDSKLIIKPWFKLMWTSGALAEIRTTALCLCTINGFRQFLFQKTLCD